MNINKTTGHFDNIIGNGPKSKTAVIFLKTRSKHDPDSYSDLFAKIHKHVNQVMEEAVTAKIASVEIVEVGGATDGKLNATSIILTPTQLHQIWMAVTAEEQALRKYEEDMRMD